MSRLTSPRIKTFSILLALLLFSACSMTRVFYNFSDWLLLNRIDDYFLLNDSQKSFLEEKIEALVVWHRNEELPAIVKTLTELKARFEDGLGHDDIDWVMLEHQALWHRFIKRALADWSAFLATVEVEQVRHLQLYMEQKNKYLIEQAAMSHQERLDDYVDWFAGVLEDWCGDLGSSQRSLIKNRMRADGKWVANKLEQRRKFQEELATLLWSKKDAAEIEKQLGRWLLQPETLWPPGFKEQVEQRKSEWKELLIKVDATLTPRQRDRVLEKIQGYIDDFRTLTQTV